VNLILLEPDEIRSDRTAVLTGLRARHASTVLGVAVGDVLRIGVVDGAVGLGTVAGVHDAAIELAVCLDDTPRPPHVDLLLALPRPKVMRRLWAQIAALGAGRIILTNAARVERHYFDTHLLDPAVYRPLLIEGLQQARDTHLPRVSVHRRFRPLVEDDLDALCPSGLRLVAQPADRAPIQPAGTTPSDRVLVAVGPEGGWVDFELELLEAHRFQRVTLGPRTLRSDTACIAILALAHAAGRAGDGAMLSR
jgi:RsmE family RNA methyltransferase